MSLDGQLDINDKEQIIQRVVGDKIRDLRQAAGIKAVELAEISGISQGQISKIETGKATLSIRTLSRLCEVMGRPLSYLFQSEEAVPRVLGTLTTVSGPEQQGLTWFSEEVYRQTNGRMTLIPLRVSQLVPAGDQVEQLRQGVIDLFIESPMYFHQFDPALHILTLPYVFDSQAHQMAFFNTDLVNRRIRSSLLRAGVRLINRSWNWWRGLESVLVSKTPILTPDQVKGLRVRVPDLPLTVRFWEEMGARPIVVSWLEVKMALRLGLVDILPTQRAHLYPLGFCRYARFVTHLGDVGQCLAAAMNDLKFQALPPAVQDALANACESAGAHFTQLVEQSERENFIKNMDEHQAAYLQVDIAPWREAAARIRQKLLDGGELDAETWTVVEQCRPHSRRNMGGEPDRQ